MHHAKKLVVALTSLLILTGCTTGNQQAANHTSVKTKTVRVEKLSLIHISEPTRP